MVNNSIDKYSIGKIVVIILVTLFVIWVIAQVLGTCNFGEKINNNDSLTILLSFIGVMATFIVIGNFSQTNYLMTDSRERLREYSERIEKGEEAKSEVSALTKRVNELEEALKNIDSKSSQSSLVEEKDLALLLSLFVGKEANVIEKMELYAKLLVEGDTYSIRCHDGSDTIAQIKLNSNNNIEFYENGNENAIINLEKIDTICGVKFDIAKLAFAYRLLHQIDEPLTGETNNETIGDNNPINNETKI